MEDEPQVQSITEHQPASNTANPEPAVITAAQPSATTENPQTTNPTHPQPPYSQQGEKYGDSSDGVWSMYLTEAEKQDKDVTESWKGDTEGILVFTGLFSATVAAFIVESYKKLSPDPGDTTNKLLTQISQQLVDISNGIPLTSVAAQSSQPFKPTASAIRVNVLWFLSLVLSLTCALSATLMQQWARRYQELSQHHGAPHRRGRVRAYVFDGISRFRMSRAVATMPTLLHISVFLFFAGLVDFLFPIDTTVSQFTLGLVVAFALTYAVLTILPNLYPNCPYATPLSGLIWRSSQLSMIVVLKTALGLAGLFHNALLSWVNLHVTSIVERWREALKSQVKVHQWWFFGGLQKHIKRNSRDPPSTVVAQALEWTLIALDEDKEIETFAAGVPGFFDSRTVPDAISAILPLMSEKSQTDAILGYRLYDLLKSCMPGTSPLNDEERKSRLQVCMKCLWYFGMAYNRPDASEPLPSYFTHTLASPEIIRRIQIEQDPVSRMMGHCFSALIAMKLAADVRSRADPNVHINDDELACLSAVLNADSRDVMICLRSDAVELASMVALASGYVGSWEVNVLPSDVLYVAQQTLTILFQAAELQLDQPIAQLNISDGNFDRIIVSRLFNLLQMCISRTSPLTADVRRSCLRMCLKCLCYFGRAYNRPGASEPLPSYFTHALASPEIIRHIQTQQDPVSRVMGHCFGALVAMKLAADLRLRVDSNVQITDDELACLSVVLNADSRDVMICLRWSGAIELASTLTLALGEVGSLNVDAWPSDVFGVAQRTLAILSQTAELQLDQPITQLNILDGKFDHIIVSRLFDLLQMCISRTSPLTAEVRRSCLRTCLKCLCYFGIAYNQPGTSESLPSYFPRTLSSPAIIYRIQTVQDPVSRMMGRCFGALVVMKLSADIRSRADPNAINDEELACLSAILNAESLDVKFCLGWSGAVELASTLTLALGNVGSLAVNALPSDVLDVAQQTLAILSRTAELQLDQPIAQLDISDGKFDRIIVSRLLSLLQMCLSRTPPFTAEVRRSCLRTCLKCLCYFGIAYNRPGTEPLPSYFPRTLASPDIIHHIHVEQDPVSRVMGRCFGALVVMKLAADLRSHADPNVQIHDKLTCLSAILGTEICDVKHSLEWPGAVELASTVSLALGDVGSLDVDRLPWDVVGVVQQTLSILSGVFPVEETAEPQLDQPIAQLNISDGNFERIIISRLRDLLQMCISGTSPPTAQVRTSCLRMCLKSLWYCAKAYHQPGTCNTLPSHFPLTLANPDIIRLIHLEKDPVSHVIRRCFEALVMSKVAAYIRSRTHSNVYISDEELACLSAILGTERSDVMPCLNHPGAFELMNMVFLASGDIGTFTPAPDTVPLYVDVVPLTFSTLCQAFPDEISTELGLNQIPAPSDTPNGTASTIGEIYRNHSIRCLKNLWRCVRAYNQTGKSEPLPSYIFAAFSSPAMTRRMHTEWDITAHVIGRCVEALVVKKLVACVRSSTDSNVQIGNEELACLSAILGTGSRDVMFCLEWPGAVELASMVSLALGDVGSLTVDALPSDVLDVVQRTLATLSRTAELQPDPPIVQLDTSESSSDAKFDRIIASRLLNLLHMCKSPTSPLTVDVRRSCLRMCLKSLWYCANVYHQRGVAEQLPSYFFLVLATPELSRHIQIEMDPVTRAIGRCFEALIVDNLAACVKSRTDSTAQNSDKAFASLLAILGTEHSNLRLWLGLPGAVGLANMVSLTFSGIDSLFSDTVPSDVLDMMQLTFGFLSRRLPAELYAELMNGTVPPTEPINESYLRTCLKNLWRCARACNQPSHQLGISVPLPSSVRNTLASSEISRRIHTHKDFAARVIGRCVEALVVNKLVDDFQSPNSFSSGAACVLSSILGTELDEFLRRPRPSSVIKLQTVISLVEGEIESLFASRTTTPADILHVVQQTLDTICSELVPGGVFVGGDQVSLLREICSNITNAQLASRFSDQWVGQLPPVEHRMRRCTSSIIDSQFIRGRSNLATPEYEVRRRSKSA